MKNIITIASSLFLACVCQAQDSLPKFYDNISLIGIETWPNAGNPDYGYMVRMSDSLPSTGCSSSSVFSVKAGDFHKETLSVLLAALAADKEIRIRVLECTDRPIVDRVEIKK